MGGSGGERATGGYTDDVRRGLMLLCSWHCKKRMENGLRVTKWVVRDVERTFGEKEVDGERGANRREARDEWRTEVSDVVNLCRQRETKQLRQGGTHTGLTRVLHLSLRLNSSENSSIAFVCFLYRRCVLPR